MIYLLIKKERVNGGENTTTVKAFSSQDMATLECVKCNYFAEQMTKYEIQHIRFDDTEEIEVTHDELSVRIEGEVDLEFDLNYNKVVDEHGEGIEVTSIGYYNTTLKELGLTKDFEERIRVEASAAAEDYKEYA